MKKNYTVSQIRDLCKENENCNTCPIGKQKSKDLPIIICEIKEQSVFPQDWEIEDIDNKNG